MKLKRILTFVPVLLLIISIAAFAEEKYDEVVNLEEIVVTATRTEKNATEAPGSISVVTRKDIESRNIQTVDEALNTLPGVFNSRTSITDISPGIAMRGMPYGLGRTLVMMDGINLVDPMLGNLFGLTGLAPENVEQIEVVRGPFSSLYGGQAMGGVVNIITKMPAGREMIVKGGYGSSWEQGEAPDDLTKFYVSYGDRFMDKLSVFFSYGIKETNGFPTTYKVTGAQPSEEIYGWSSTTNPMGNPQYLIGDTGDTAWWDDNTTIKAEYEFSENSKINFTFSKSRFETNYDDPHTYLRDTDGNPVWSYGSVGEYFFLPNHDRRREQESYHLSYQTEIFDVKSIINLNYVDSTFGAGVPYPTSSRSGGAGREWDNPFDRYYNVEMQFTTPPLFKRHVLTFGGFFGHNMGQMDEYNRTNWKKAATRTDLTYRSKGKDRTFSLFAQDEIILLDNLMVYIGFRQDWWKTYDGFVFQQGFPDIEYNSNSESSISPKVAVVYKPFAGMTFRASAGKAFRAPTIVELYRTWTHPSVGITYAGNYKLEPEKTKSWDIGVEQVLWKGATVKVTYFENYMKNFIQRAMTTPTLYENKNVGEAESKGIDLEAEQDFENWLKLFTNFTYTDSEVTKNEANPAIVGKSLTMLPDILFNIGADMTKGNFSFGIVGRYVDKVYKNDDNSDDVDGVYSSYDPYFVADIKASYRFLKYATFSISVNNLFNEDYFYSDKAPGRSWFGELAVRF